MKYLILFLFVFSLGAQDNEAEEVTVESEKMELLKAINSVLPSTYNLNFTDIESCDLEMTYADEQKQMTWQFNHLSMDYLILKPNESHHEKLDNNLFVYLWNEDVCKVDKPEELPYFLPQN